MARARQGDRAAFDALIAPLRGGLLGIAFVRTGDYLEAEDLTQEALCRAWDHISDLRDASAFPGWLRSILNRACASWHRHNFDCPVSLYDVTLRDFPADNGLQPLEVLLRREREEELRMALCGIPEANRIALLMAIWGDCSYQDIADFSGVPVSTVEGRIYRAKSQLRRKLGSRSSELFGEPDKRWQENPEEETSK